MAMARIWTVIVAASLIFGCINGKLAEVSAAAIKGAAAAVELCLTMAGALSLWAGISEIMVRSGLSAKLKRLFYPLLCRLFPDTARNSEAMAAISENVTANMLGLGNAATNPGVKAIRLMAEKTGGIASNDMCAFVVLNTASFQLLPSTVASIRAAAGAVLPFDILPAVWITSLVSIAAGLISARLFSRKSI